MFDSPLIIYLDTQDYIRIFNEPDGGPAHSILDQILAFRDRGQIVIGYSWVTMLEFITRPTDDFREERVRRGMLVKDICGWNAFPFYSDIKHGVRFPNNGFWMPKNSEKLISAKWFRDEMEKQFHTAIAQQPSLNRADRRRLKSSSGKRKFFSDISVDFGTKREDFKGFPVSDEFIESRVLSRLMKGQCSDTEFEEAIYRWFSDPAEYSRIAYDYADKPNLLDEFFGPGISRIEDSFRQLQEFSRNLDELDKLNLKTRKNLIEFGIDKRTATRLTKPASRLDFDPSEIVQRIERQVGEGRAGHIGHYTLKALSSTLYIFGSRPNPKDAFAGYEL